MTSSTSKYIANELFCAISCGLEGKTIRRYFQRKKAESLEITRIHLCSLLIVNLASILFSAMEKNRKW